MGLGFMTSGPCKPVKYAAESSAAVVMISDHCYHGPLDVKYHRRELEVRLLFALRVGSTLLLLVRGEIA